MKITFRDQRGFSLLEMMLVIAISTMMAYAMFAVMRAGDNQIQMSEVKMTIQESAREGLYRMIQEIRMSAPARITMPTESEIEFEIPDADDRVTGSYDVNWAGAHTIRYERGGASGNQIIRTNVTTGETSVIGNDVTALSFTGNGENPSIVTITVSTQKTLLNGQLAPASALQVSGRAEVRNG